MRWVTKLMVIVALGITALALGAAAARAEARIDGHVVDCHGVPIANIAVTLSPGGLTQYTNASGQFSFAPGTPGYYYVTVAGETRGPYYFSGSNGPGVHIGEWKVCPRSNCRPPCEINDPGPPGPTSAVNGDDDMPNVSPGDQDARGGGDIPDNTRRAARLVTIQGATPNPFSGSVRVMLNIAGVSARIAGRVYDVRGRQVRSLPPTLMSAGQHSLVWDGRDDNGTRVQAGVYFVQVVGVGRSGIVRVAFMP